MENVGSLGLVSGRGSEEIFEGLTDRIKAS